MNDDLQVEKIGDNLKGKSIALVVSGGIAAIEAPKIARHIRRYGGSVTAYPTPSATQFVGNAALEWGTGRPIVTNLSGLAEHICLEDLVLVAPATTNTINKTFAGIADNNATTLIASALGMGKPVHMAPTMHQSLYNNPFLQQHLKNASHYGITIIDPRISEGKAKIPHPDTLVAKISRELSTDPIKGKKVLITGGPTPGKIDAVRRITNVFRGTLAVEMAKEAYFRGADVKLLLGKTGIHVPEYIDTTFHNDFHEYRANVHSELDNGYDTGIFSAAVADYIPKNVAKGKLKSGGILNQIELVSTPKVIREVRDKYPNLQMVTFKYEHDVTVEELAGIAKDRINSGYDLVVANRGAEMQGKHSAYIYKGKTVVAHPHSKRHIATSLFDVLPTKPHEHEDWLTRVQ